MASSSGRCSYNNIFPVRDLEAESKRTWEANRVSYTCSDVQFGEQGLLVNSVPQEAVVRENFGSRSQSETHIASFSWTRPSLTQPINYETLDYDALRQEDTRRLTPYSKKLLAQRALSQDGSRLFQTMICENPIMATNILYQAVFEHMFDIMIGEFGNYVFSRVIENCDEPRLVELVEKLTRDARLFVAVVCNKYGAESVKRLIKFLEKSRLVSRITLVVAKEFKRLMTDRTAPYVVFKCFQHLKAEQTKELYKLLIHNCIELATDERGCITLNESIDYLKQPYRSELFYNIANEARFLSQDPIGNYVVQKVMGLNIVNVNRRIYSKLKGYFVDFCTHKASSHVVEKCLNCDIGMNYVLEDFIEYGKLWQIARNQYGNYVIQRAIKRTKCANSPLYSKLVTKLNKDKEKFQTDYGKNVYALIVEGFDQS